MSLHSTQKDDMATFTDSTKGAVPPQCSKAKGQPSHACTVACRQLDTCWPYKNGYVPREDVSGVRQVPFTDPGLGNAIDLPYEVHSSQLHSAQLVHSSRHMREGRAEGEQVGSGTDLWRVPGLL